MAEKKDEDIVKELGLKNSDEETSENVPKEKSFQHDNEKLESQTQDTPADENQDSIEDLKTNKTSIDGVEENINEDSKNTNFKDQKPKLQKKKSKPIKALMGLILFFIGFFVIILILFFIGFFDSKQNHNKNAQTTKIIKQKKKNEEINLKEINKVRLNNKLKNLTQREFFSQKEPRGQKRKASKQEEEADIQKKKKQLEEVFKNHQKLIKKQEKEFLKLQKMAKLDLENEKKKILKELETKKSTIAKTQEKKMDNKVEESKSMFLLYINVVTVNGDLLKSNLDKIEKSGRKISLCRDSKNRIEVYLGPYSSNKERERALSNLLVNDFKNAYLVGLTKEEYKKRCEY